MCLKHLGGRDGSVDSLYRILYYDCFPLSKKAHNPISNRSVDFSKSEIYLFRLKFFEELKKLRKVAVRTGELRDGGKWLIQPDKQKKLLRGITQVSDLEASDVTYDVTQKGVDIKIGTDIASIAYKKLANKIILVSGDSDFVPAAKLARREGIDFVLDPMWNPIRPDLNEHIDGLKSVCPRPSGTSSS